MSIWRRGLWRYRLTTASVVLAAFGTSTALNSPPVVLSVVAAAAGVLVSTLEIRANRRRARAVRFQPRDADTYRDIAEHASDLGRVLESARNIGIVMTDASVRLRQQAVAVDPVISEYVLHRDLKPWSFDFLARQARRAVMHNAAVLGLGSDLPGEGDDGVVVLRSAHYFDFFCSNVLVPYDVCEVGRRNLALRGRDLIVDRHGRLRTFRNSRLANIIGVSTLAFTSDGQLLLVAQTRDNVGSPGLLAPSGSGSLEPQDVSPQSTPTLQEIIRTGAERELREECHINSAEIEGSDLLGYGRWLSRGATPEFCAVTFLNVAGDQLVARAVRRTERPYVGEVMAVDLTPAADWDLHHPVGILPPDIRHAASWPLAFALSCLAERMGDDSWPAGKELAARLDQ
ncbi:NUDIX hydrolase [Micromonospora sp. NPDC048898]|uniref:NUDIX hydrolase n=1 Tax=Micromonospora sp. NPDC048898 TaxID=3364260 RepID=UPI003719B446